ncbi:hypothetical protein, partial [Achromobacter marplatensis]|uniref:hypothetical protein n=1 Tax=Achromobacter marplatensis TaxID=470868 RepID=UPI001F288FBF
QHQGEISNRSCDQHQTRDSDPSNGVLDTVPSNGASAKEEAKVQKSKRHLFSFAPRAYQRDG